MCGKKAESSADEARSCRQEGGLCSPIRWLWCFRLQKKAAGPASGGLIKSSGNRERGQTATRINGPFR
jgi:hypothetical protein